jgi:hypothetical protein
MPKNKNKDNTYKTPKNPKNKHFFYASVKIETRRPVKGNHPLTQLQMTTRQTNEEFLVALVAFSFMAFMIATVDRRTVEFFIFYLALGTIICTVNVLVLSE